MTISRKVFSVLFIGFFYYFDNFGNCFGNLDGPARVVELYLTYSELGNSSASALLNHPSFIFATFNNLEIGSLYLFSIHYIAIQVVKDMNLTLESESCKYTCFINRFSKPDLWIALSLDFGAIDNADLLTEIPFIFRKHTFALISNSVKVPARKANLIGARALIRVSQNKTAFLCRSCARPAWIAPEKENVLSVKKHGNFATRCMNIQFWRSDSLRSLLQFRFSIFKENVDKDILKMKLDDAFYQGLGGRASLIVTQYLMKSLNVSVLNCYRKSDGHYQYPSNEPLDLHFKLVTISSKLEESLHSNLQDISISSKVQFLTAKTVDDRVLWASLIGPLGVHVFITTVALIPILIFIIYAFSRWERGSISLDDISSAVIRPLFDQCLENQLPSTKLYFRLVLAVWLYYCLLVSETYRSELTSFLTRGNDGKWLRTFAEIARNAEKLTFAPANFETNQMLELMSILKSEYEMHAESDGKYSRSIEESYKSLNKTTSGMLKWGQSWRIEWFAVLKAIMKGTACLIGSKTQLTAVCEIFRHRYGQSVYQISDDSITSYETWAVWHGPLKSAISCKVQWMRDTGILIYVYGAREDAYKEQAKNYFKREVFDRKEMQQFGRKLNENTGNGPKVLKVFHIVSVLVLMVLGLSISSITALVEVARKSEKAFKTHYKKSKKYCSKIKATKVITVVSAPESES